MMRDAEGGGCSPGTDADAGAVVVARPGAGFRLCVVKVFSERFLPPAPFPEAHAMPCARPLLVTGKKTHREENRENPPQKISPLEKGPDPARPPPQSR